jgi:hypothetical protein
MPFQPTAQAGVDLAIPPALCRSVRFQAIRLPREIVSLVVRRDKGVTDDGLCQPRHARHVVQIINAVASRPPAARQRGTSRPAWCRRRSVTTATPKDTRCLASARIHPNHFRYLRDDQVPRHSD